MMNRLQKLLVCISLVSCLTVFGIPYATADSPELVGIGSVSGTETDHSGLKTEFRPGVTDSLLGGFSALEYSGAGQVYYALPDRGPNDGEFPWRCRIQQLEIQLPEPSGLPRAMPANIGIRCIGTVLLSDGQGKQFSGLKGALTGSTNASVLRFDPEGLRILSDGAFLISEEYGPEIRIFSQQGDSLRTLVVPERYRVKNLSGDPKIEAVTNVAGRQPNRGFEGIAVSPDGSRAYAILQGPLIQDSVESAKGKRTGRNVRLAEFDLKTGILVREFVYQLDDSRYGISEILAVSSEEFLLIERDGEPGEEAAFKKIVRASITGATDVSGMGKLPTHDLPEGVTPVRREEFLDLLAPEFGLRGSSFPEKVEGLCFGPALPDGRRVLLICSDNDFVPEASTRVWAFAFRP